MDLEAHRRAQVDHFVRLFQLDPAYARYAVAEYQRNFPLLFPKIGHDVKAKLDELGLLTPDKTSTP